MYFSMIQAINTGFSQGQTRGGIQLLASTPLYCGTFNSQWSFAVASTDVLASGQASIETFGSA